MDMWVEKFMILREISKTKPDYKELQTLKEIRNRLEEHKNEIPST